MNIDGFVNSPISVLRFISRSLRRTASTPRATRSARLDLGLFTKPSIRRVFHEFLSLRLLLDAIGALVALLLFTGEAQAHRVNVFAWVTGDTVFVECNFPDGTKVHEGVIRVLDSAGKELLTGKTNDKGEFSFKVPKQEDLNIVLDAVMGHRADWLLSKQDLLPAGSVQESDASSQSAPKTEDPPAAAQASSAGASSPPPAGIDQAIEKALDKKLAPVMKMLAEMHEQKVRLTDVLGGIGYIIGLVGIAAYFKRKK
jgi:nickel transport protein